MQEIHVSYYFIIFECGFNVCYWRPEKQTCLSGIIELPVDFQLAVFVAAAVAATIPAAVAAFLSELEV